MPLGSGALAGVPYGIDREFVATELGFGGVSANSRNAHMKTLLDSGFGRVEQQTVMAHLAPVPPRKPQISTQVASALNDTRPAAGDARGESKWRGAEDRMMQGAAFSEMIGEGDYDPAVSKRLETGLMAIAALKGQGDVSAAATGRWSVQVGAFGSRAKTDRAIAHALQNLPAGLASSASAAIAPMKTQQGWLFRGRLTGLTQAQAVQACTILKDCLPVAPQSY